MFERSFAGDCALKPPEITCPSWREPHTEGVHAIAYNPPAPHYLQGVQEMGPFLESDSDEEAGLHGYLPY